MAKILLAEDDEIMRVTMYDTLTAQKWQIDQAVNGREALSAIEQKNYNIVISDIKMPGVDGLSLLDKIQKNAPQTDVILITAYGSVENAVQCLKKGAADYILKPFDLDDLTIRVNRLLQMQEVKLKYASLKEQRGSLKIIGKSSEMEHVLNLIVKVAPSDSSVLVTGESGTGKELVAEAVHRNSRRSEKPYIRINCGAIPENLMESELFGHEKGAFTGAHARKIGKFELADGGTLLLDEIGDLPLPLQVKLLRALQEQEIERVGGCRTIPVNVRIICATAKDLVHEVKEGRFREDLFYRLQVIPIEIPPLRRHKDDIPILCDHFLEEFSRPYQSTLKLTYETRQYLQEYNYPGNVRELRNIIERASVLSTGPVIGKDELPADLTGSMPERRKGPTALADAVAAAEKSCILRALAITTDNKTEAAKVLGISRKNLWEKMKLHRLGAN